MTKSCNVEGCNYPVFSKGYCKYHTPKKPITRISSKGKIVKENKKILLQQDFAFYLNIWENNKYEYHNHWCYECGKGIIEPLLTNFHHLLYKEKYPEYRHLDKNICIICADCHNQTHSNIDKTPKIKMLTELLTKELLK